MSGPLGKFSSFGGWGGEGGVLTNKNKKCPSFQIGGAARQLRSKKAERGNPYSR